MTLEKFKMGKYRAIMTTTDRERITGKADVPDDKRHQAVHRVRSRIEELKTDVEILDEHNPQLLEELRTIVGPGDQWLRSELEKKRADLETEFPGAVPKLTRLNTAGLGLWVRINTGDHHWELVEMVDDIGEYLHARGYSVRAAYDTKKGSDMSNHHYEGHLFALPSEVGTPEYPVSKMPLGASRIDKHSWDVTA